MLGGARGPLTNAREKIRYEDATEPELPSADVLRQSSENREKKHFGGVALPAPAEGKSVETP